MASRLSRLHAVLLAVFCAALFAGCSCRGCESAPDEPVGGDGVDVGFPPGPDGSILPDGGPDAAFPPDGGPDGSVPDAGPQGDASVTVPVITPTEINPALPSDLEESTAFLYTGDDPAQVGVDAGTIDSERVVVLHGRTLNPDGSPLAGVEVTAPAAPELGVTHSRASGEYDFAANGGGSIALAFRMPGRISAQRQVRTGWREFGTVPDVILLPRDFKATRVSMGASRLQLARGSRVQDADGARQPTLLVPAGVQATLHGRNGPQSLATLSVRATEFTVGDDGPKAMPAALPPAIGYTYALELTADEADGEDGEITFDQPLLHYVENFLGFPVGSPVPVGYYDREKARWVASRNGRVIKVLSVQDGLAALDTDGDGAADGPAALQALGVTDAEREQLAGLYAAGQSLWRVPIPHFSPWDCNWPYGPPDDAEPPPVPPPEPPKHEDEGDEKCGSIIDCQNGSLGESIPLAGVPFALRYSSARHALSPATLVVPLSGASVPASLTRIELQVQVAGQTFEKSFSAAPNQTHTFVWDGKDAFGRKPVGYQPALARVGYVYPAVYQQPADFDQAFGRLSGVPIEGSPSRQELTLWRETRAALAGAHPDPTGLGGWTLEVLHVFDPVGHLLLLGDGTVRSEASLQSQKIETAAGAHEALLEPGTLATAPDGSVYFLDVSTTTGSNAGGLVRRIAPDGTISTVAGNGSNAFSGDGGPATAAGLGTVTALAVGPDGSLYIGSGRGVHPDCRIRRVGSDGIIQTIAGKEVFYNGYLSSCCTTEDDDYRTKCTDGAVGDVVLGTVQSMVVTADGTVHFLDDRGVRTLGTDGYITKVAGADTLYARSLALGPDGSLYLADIFGVSRLWPDGRLTQVAGHASDDWEGHVNGSLDEGVNARHAKVYVPAIAVSAQGTLVIADAADYDRPLVRVRALAPDGTLSTFAGLPSLSAPAAAGFGDGGPATQARLQDVVALAFDTKGALFIVDQGQKRIRRVESPWAGFGGGGIPSPDGTEIYLFSASGRHDRTLDAVTGAVRWQFAYDSQGLLATVRDAQGNTTRIERDGAGRPTAIVSPFGHRTRLAVDGEGMLARVTDPLNGAYVMDYGARGMLASFTDPAGGAHGFEYDAYGRLVSDQGPGGSGSTLSRAETATGYVARITTALGRTTEYRREDTALGQRTTTVAASGEQTVELRGKDGALSTTYPDGTVVTTGQMPDPRFGLYAPLQSLLTITTPGGRQLVQQRSRSVTLTDPANPLSLTALHDTWSVNGYSRRTVYDAATRTLTTTTAVGRASLVEYDAQGRPVSFTVPGLRPLGVTYDAKGRAATLSQGGRTTTLGYGADGALASVTDALGQSTTLLRDAAGRVISQVVAGRTIGLARDALGQLTGLTPPGRSAHLLGYDALGHLTSYTPPPAGAAVAFSFNADREQTGFAVPGLGQVSIGYDAGGRPQSIAQPGRTVTLAYEAGTGRIQSMTASDGGSLTFVYDGALLTGVTLAGAVAGTVERTFDDALRLASEQVNGAHQVTFDYDGDGLAVRAGALTIQRSGSTPAVVGTSLGTLAEVRGYDDFGEVESLSFTAGGAATALFRLQVVRDALGRVTTRTETVLGDSHSYGYVYDAAGRLAEVTVDGAAQAQHAYDDNGNRLSRIVAGAEVAGSYDTQDRVTSWGDATYAWGADGQLASRTRNGAQVTGFEYDLLGELRAVTLPDGRRIDYVLDPDERRVGRKVNGVLQRGWIYGAGRSPLAEVDASGAVVSRFVYGTNEEVPDYMVRGGITYRIVTDLLGSPRLVVNAATGAVAQRLDYDELGRVTQDTQPGFQPFGFAGGLHDPDTGLVRFGARDYDPEVGRWTARDPALFAGRQTNLYGYADGDPVNFVDRSGLGGTELATPQFSLWDIFKMGLRSTFGSWGRKALDESDYGTYKSVEKVANHLNTTIPNYRMMEANLALLNNPNRCGEAVDYLVWRNGQQQQVISDTAEAAGRVYESAYTKAVTHGLGNPVDAATDAAKDAAPGLLERLWNFFH